MGLEACTSFQGPQNFQGSGFFSSSKASPKKLFWPVKNPKISQKFKNSFWTKHQGIDLRGRKGQPIFAAAKGRVLYVGSGFRGYGKMILIEHSYSLATLYAHLSGYKARAGQRVQRGQVIGYMGNTGRSTGVHLHFEVLKNKNPVDPMGYYSEALRN